jgi:hypothetical protein
MGNTVITYDLERTLCDVIRSRNKMDRQIVIDALKIMPEEKTKIYTAYISMLENSALKKY